jgi:protein SCO1/2
MKTRATRPGRIRLWLPALAGLIVTVGVVGAWAWWHRGSVEPLEVHGTVPDFSLVDRSGRTVTRPDLLGKVSVVDFFYTRCPDTCPLQSAHLARLQAELSGARDMLLISITVDPDHDNRDVLAAYAQRFRADAARWLFLTGPREAIYHLAVDGFHLAATASREPGVPPDRAWIGPARALAHERTLPEQADDGARVIRLVHASRFALVDRRARVRGYFDGTDWDAVKRLEEHLKRLLGHSSLESIGQTEAADHQVTDPTGTNGPRERTRRP